MQQYLIQRLQTMTYSEKEQALKVVLEALKDGELSMLLQMATTENQRRLAIHPRAYPIRPPPSLFFR